MALTLEQQKGVDTAKKTLGTLEGLNTQGFGKTDISQLPQGADIKDIPSFQQRLQDKIEEPTPTDAFKKGLTRNDILDRATSVFEQGQSTREQLLGAFQPSERELQLTEQIKGIRTGGLQGEQIIRGQAIPQPLIGKQAEVLREQVAFKELPLVQELESATLARATQVDALTAVIGADQQTFNNLLKLQELTKPDVIKTETDPQTGEIIAITQNQDGSFGSQIIGQVTPEVAGIEFSAKGTFTNSANQEVFWGLTPEGEMVTQILGEGKVSGAFEPQDLSANAIKVRSSVRQEPAFTDFVDMLNAFQNTKVGFNLNNAAGDLAIVNGIAKILDPGSVIRPAEFETVKEAQGFFEQVANFPFKVASGRIAGLNARKRFLELAEQLILEKATPLKSNLQTAFEPIASGFGLDLNDIVPEIGQLDTIVSEIGQGVRTDDELRDEAQKAGVEISESEGNAFTNFFSNLFK